MRNLFHRSTVIALLMWGGALSSARADDKSLDSQLTATLKAAGFTGRIESTLEPRLGRKINPVLAELGKLLFFDRATAVHQDNMCAGCHAPTHGMGDSQSIAIGIQNNNVVGRGRSGPRNQRRTPTIVNTAFYPRLMWNGRFGAISGDPFDNSQPFSFPLPEGITRFPGKDPRVQQLLSAHAHMPPTETTEVAGFTGVFDDAKGSPLPAPDASGSTNEPIRQFLLTNRLNSNPIYVGLFKQLFPGEMAAHGNQIDFFMFGRAIAEFEFTQVFANAPLDRFARGDTGALSTPEKRGALLFFGKGRCVSCHAVAGGSNEMFSDSQNHTIGAPQVAALFGVGSGNVIFDGPGADEDFGLEQVSGNPADRYKFRTAPLRNLAVSPAFFHNGAFTRLEDAIRFHLDPKTQAPRYDARKAGLAPDLTRHLGPIRPVLDRLDPLLQIPIALSNDELGDLVKFVSESLLDPRARSTCSNIPSAVPSGLSLPKFQGCGNGND
jgi:cytochrome c peroxidase